jgi:hypothetical protein
MKFLNFYFIFVGHFCPPGSGSGSGFDPVFPVGDEGMVFCFRMVEDEVRKSTMADRATKDEGLHDMEQVWKSQRYIILAEIYDFVSCRVTVGGFLPGHRFLKP